MDNQFVIDREAGALTITLPTTGHKSFLAKGGLTIVDNAKTHDFDAVTIDDKQYRLPVRATPVLVDRELDLWGWKIESL